jgi:hypothetical protein
MNVTMNLVDAITGVLRMQVKMLGRDVDYTLNDGTAGVLRAWVRGVRAEDLFAGAVQQDMAGVVNADEFVARFPARIWPARFDRLRTRNGRTYSVEEIRGAPNDEKPVFFKLLLRGGSQ